MEKTIKSQLTYLCKRKKAPIYDKKEPSQYGKPKTVYRYLICDRCGKEIELYKKKEDRQGGTLQLSYIITGITTTEIAVCRQCLKKVYEEFR